MENKENESLKISAKLVDLEDAEEFLKKSAIGKEKIKIAAGDKKSEKVSMEVPVAEKSENSQAREDNCEELNLQDYQLELENRIRNLLWTISGDYTQQMKRMFPCSSGQRILHCMMELSRAHWRNSSIKIFWECIW